MFEKDLKARLQRIFDFKKSTFDDPGESMEQECLFISVENPNVHITEYKQRARVEGTCFVFCNTNHLPFGYFDKCLSRANAADKLPFFFYEIDRNAAIGNNIVRRSFKFVFFFEAQYDPNMGEITSVNFLEGEAP